MNEKRLNEIKKAKQRLFSACEKERKIFLSTYQKNKGSGGKIILDEDVAVRLVDMMFNRFAIYIRDELTKLHK